MYDLIIRNGEVIDGAGSAAFPADVGVVGDRIATVGRIREHAINEIDAEGMVITPGFIDGHTHMDAQIFWDPLGTSSCWHGVTTVIMGHCGFTLAPAGAANKELAIKNLERAEDISAQALATGIPDWSWESFSEYLAALDQLPKAINYATNIGHSALRSWAMGERAFEAEASEDEIERMEREVRSAIRAGAFGFTTSRSTAHLTSDDRPVASRQASWNEVQRLVAAMTDAGGYIFQLANEPAGSTTGQDEGTRREYFGRLTSLSAETGAAINFNMLPSRGGLQILDIIDDAVERRGARMFALVHPRGTAILLSFETQLPYDSLAEWQAFRKEPLSEQRRILKDPGRRERLIEAACSGAFTRSTRGAEAPPPNYDLMYPLTSPYPPHKSIAELAAEHGKRPVEVVIDLALENDLKCFFVQPFDHFELNTIEHMMRHPRTVVALSDSGAHVGQICEASLYTYLLSYWVRENGSFTLPEAVRLVTFDPATAWGFHDRGLVREGFISDLNVLDPERISPGMPEVVHDLPGGSKRIIENAQGIAATIVGGQVVFRDGEHTGTLPGRILKSHATRHVS
jgi:N-acyl-D-aspartate/D-glutamate deacylase